MTNIKPNIEQTQLDVVKYLGVQFWPYVFGKQIDNLRTDNAGTFMILDKNRFIGRLSTGVDFSGKNKELAEECRLRQRAYSFYIVGLIKGALKNMGTAIGKS
eukprot:CAMPEP_0168617424 /NCGR_PEP_ID=MMETSP0449_2-20121227/5534_1 /TAXON_ID=1082188 /ORGANISM="Strombidium rassoulzadegani, Strain ras09" /LENGTH=101 /DNA_ID=CAMNT_0008658237 /DNA_START=363 /DNA_END=668 /DNA_ORIENTATION=-